MAMRSVHGDASGHLSYRDRPLGLTDKGQDQCLDVTEPSEAVSSPLSEYFGGVIKRLGQNLDFAVQH